MSERFYINWPLQPGPAYLEGPEAHHLAVVCRLRPGDSVTLFNGDGHEYPARLVSAARRSIELDVTDRLTPRRELSFPLELAAPLPRGDRGQFLIEKLTELGVTTFVPLSCQHSVLQPREARQDKLRRHVIEASKQCGRNVLMNVADQIPWAAYAVQPGPDGSLSILAHPCREARSLSAAARPEASGYRLAVGPEAGFTAEEVKLAHDAGWRILDMGPRVLRIETAAMVLAAWVAALPRSPEIGG